MRRHPLARLLLTIPLTGALVASMLTAAWLALGRPTPLSASVWLQVEQVGGDASFSGAPDQPFFFLALGNDDRGRRAVGNGDAVHVIGVDPTLMKATIMDVPRDTEAPDGTKLTNSHATGGLPRMVEQLNQLLGVQISYAITTSFPGFRDLVDGIGGIDITLEQAMNDPDSEAHLPAGPQHLNGEQALAYSRNRKQFGPGDRTRTVNQGLLMLATLTTLRAQNPGPVGTLKLVALLGRHVRMEGVDLAELYRLGRLALSLDPANVRNVLFPTLPGRFSTNLPPDPAGAPLVADFADNGLLDTH